MQTLNNVLCNPYISGHFLVEPIQSLTTSIVRESISLKDIIKATLIIDAQSSSNIGSEKNSLIEFLLHTVELVQAVAIAFLGAPVLATIFVIGCIAKTAFFYLAESFKLTLLKMNECVPENYPELINIVSIWQKLGYTNRDFFGVTPSFSEHLVGCSLQESSASSANTNQDNTLICRDEADNVRAIACLGEESVAFTNQSCRRDYIQLTHLVTHPENNCSTINEDRGVLAIGSAIFLITCIARECLNKNKAGVYVEATGISKHFYKELDFEEVSKERINKQALFENPMILSFKNATRRVFIHDIEDVETRKLVEGDREWDALWLKIAGSILSWDEIRELLQIIKNRQEANAELVTSIDKYDSWLKSIVRLEDAMKSNNKRRIAAASRDTTPLMAQIALQRSSGFSPRAKLLCSMYSLLKLKKDLSSSPESIEKLLEKESSIFGKQAAFFSVIRQAFSTMSQKDFQGTVRQFIKAESSATSLIESIMPSIQYDVDPRHYQRKVVPLHIPEGPIGIEINELIEWFHGTVPTIPFQQLEKWFEDDYQIKSLKESMRKKIIDGRLQLAKEHLSAEVLQLKIEEKCHQYVCSRLYRDLERYIDRIKTKQAYTGTPPADTSALDVFYENIERALKHVIKKINNMDHGERSLSTKTRALVDILQSAGHCGPRIQNVAIKNYREIVQEVPQTFENIIYQRLDDLRDKIIETALAPKGSESVVYYTRAVYALGKELGIPGFELVVSAGSLPFSQGLGGRFEELRDRVRFFGRYVPSFIHEWIALDINQDMDLRSKCLEWFKERVRVDWTSEDVTNARASLAVMRHENWGPAEIREALLGYGIQVNAGQSPEEAIEDRRREDYVAAEVTEVVDNRPRIKLQSIYKMLEELYVLRKVSEAIFSHT